MKSETGSLADSSFCLGCGHEHNCGMYGCAVIGEAIKTAKLYQAAYKVLERQRDCDTCLYNVEDISGTHTDPYHYKLYFNTNVLPEVELKP